jgi:peptidyl-prolyl cis-trans isomerase A (cyclophilin A)
MAIPRWLTVASALLAVDCRRSVPPPGEETSKPKAQAASASAVTSAASGAPAVASAVSVPTPAKPSDPVRGKFTLADATLGLKSKGRLFAELDTDKGKLRCELFEDKAPNTVANFVGLARGLRPFKDPKTSEWVKRPAYDGTGFHRIIKGFMIQGGDPTGTGAGEPGYVFADEVWPGATHDRRGLLCMANRGPNTNGMQFFILDGPAKHLDASFTIFGRCTPDSVIEKLANVEVRAERAVKPPTIKKVTVLRK